MDIKINLPDDIEEYRQELKVFFDAMVYKLHQNAHKGKWEDTTFEQVEKRILDEFSELEEAIIANNTVEIILEGADVANFAMIAASVAVRGDKQSD